MTEKKAKVHFEDEKDSESDSGNFKTIFPTFFSLKHLDLYY